MRVYGWWNPGIILSMSEYPRIPRILFQEGLWQMESWDNPEYVRVSQDSKDTFQEGLWQMESWDNPEYVRVSQDSRDTFPAGGILG